MDKDQLITELLTALKTAKKMLDIFLNEENRYDWWPERAAIDEAISKAEAK